MGLVLYGVAILLDVVPIALRYWIGTALWGAWGGVVLGFGPLLWSLAALLGVPSGGQMTRWELGGRQTSQRERTTIDTALGVMQRTGVRLPHAIFMLDHPTMNAYVVGTTLYVERGLIGLPELPAVLAHELGHLNSLDGRLIYAARRLMLPGMLGVARMLFGITQLEIGVDPRTGHRYAASRRVSGCGCLAFYLALLLAAVSGGFGFLLLRPLWRRYWRQREYVADAYAAYLGQALPLANALERVLLLDAALPFMGHGTHPPTELRIDRLLRQAHGERLPSDVGEYVKLGLLTAGSLVLALPPLLCVLTVWIMAWAKSLQP